MTPAAKSLLLTLLESHWISASHSTECIRDSAAIELKRLGMVTYHPPMNAWFITDAGKLAANRLNNQLEKETA